MQIFVKSLDSTFAVTVGDNADVRELKAAIEDLEFVPAGEWLDLALAQLWVRFLGSGTARQGARGFFSGCQQIAHPFFPPPPTRSVTQACSAS